MKKNFAKHRVFHNLDSWNEQAINWIHRTGNFKIHNTTKKRPVEVFALEKRHLKPVSKIVEVSPTNNSITRSVRKDTLNGKQLGHHKISTEKGKLIQDTKHKRDRTKGIDKFIETVIAYFDDQETAKNWIEKLRKTYPRYIRGQLQNIARVSKNTSTSMMKRRSVNVLSVT